MALMGKLSHNELEYSFTIAKLSEQKFAEIDPKFICRFGNNITKTWTILNNQGVHHVLIYNKDEIHPLIISGWKDVEDFYNCPSNAVLEVGYYMDDNFSILNIKNIEDIEQLPFYHSRFWGANNIMVFDLGLTNVELCQTKLRLDEDFAALLKDYNYNCLNLCCDNGTRTILNLAYINTTYPTKLGPDWEEFCQTNMFKVGDTIRFRFDVRCPNKKCHVYKIH
ncbi:uncharacterized protein LOC131641284 [Vicia villosa]|uniref:uncharacterized protein LOC131641284 n=1 Tax=Vicia villosa TaxID=3911 RepID=UPI00273AF381|nr:uncharacterized protein LOC131641284 [Vicia villosa]